MNKKLLIVLLSLTIAILAVVPESFAGPQYLSNLTAVYGDGSCGTCHVTNPGSGQRDFNGTVGQHNSSNGTFERRDTNRTARSNGTFRQRSSNRTLPLNSYGTLFENQPDHTTNPDAALMAIGQPPTSALSDTPTSTGTQAAPGFEIVVSLFGLFVGILMVRGHNK